MPIERFIFWIVAVAATVTAGWWLSIRPGACYRGAATTVSCLLVVLALLLCMLALTGQDAQGYAAGTYSLITGR